MRNPNYRRIPQRWDGMALGLLFGSCGATFILLASVAIVGLLKDPTHSAMLPLLLQRQAAACAFVPANLPGAIL
jgi:hypothetical protein